MRPQNNPRDLAGYRLLLLNGPVPGQAMAQNQKRFLIQLMCEKSSLNMSTPETEYGGGAKLSMRLGRAASSGRSDWALNLPARVIQQQNPQGLRG